MAKKQTTRKKKSSSAGKTSAVKKTKSPSTTKKKSTRKKQTKKRSKASSRKGTAQTHSRRTGKSRDAETSEKIESLAGSIVDAALGMRDPHFDVPTRSLSNTRWNAKQRILEMGNASQRRNLFNLGQAKKFMQSLLVSKSIRELIAREKTSSLRGIFYACKHTIAGTKEETFEEQSESDAILEDLEVTIDALREELHVFAKKRGAMVGNVTIIDNGDEIDCRRMGSGGYAIPSITEPDVIQFKKCEADFILHVEKDTVWQRFNEDKFWKKYNCILTEGSGQPPRGVRRLLRRMNQELGLPVYCLLDCDPWGHYIYSVIKQGSINLAFESERMAVPDAKFIGIRAMDYERYELSDSVKISMNDKDKRRAKQIMEYPWFKDKKAWQKEIRKMLQNDFKMEVESLITKDISYVTDVYVPDRLEEGDFLD